MSEVTRNYGETASTKWVNLLHLGIAILAVTFLVMLAMGWRWISRILLCAIDLCFDFIQLLYAGLYVEPNHPICLGFGGNCRR
jgi:hypothetical protein